MSIFCSLNLDMYKHCQSENASIQSKLMLLKLSYPSPHLSLPIPLKIGANAHAYTHRCNWLVLALFIFHHSMQARESSNTSKNKLKHSCHKLVNDIWNSLIKTSYVKHACITAVSKLYMTCSHAAYNQSAHKLNIVISMRCIKILSQQRMDNVLDLVSGRQYEAHPMIKVLHKTDDYQKYQDEYVCMCAPGHIHESVSVACSKQTVIKLSTLRKHKST